MPLVTTLPFIELSWAPNSGRENWTRAECELCDWYADGSESSAEEYAADHLEDVHPRRYHKAWQAIQERRRTYSAP